ncbi:ATP-dependent DNA helicase pcrA [Rickettsiales bacterium Ac37b]|nr:ATP-dependent DNA helicase pcrA [Rickettsiales bacterium Ac37b]
MDIDLATNNIISTSDYLFDLNKDQRDAVCTLNGPLLVLAGAGTGKTRVLTTRIAHIILSNHATPSQVLAVTFTNKAAKEMQNRILNMVDAQGLWLGTFHSIAARILRRHSDLLGLNSNYNIIDASDQLKLVKSTMANLNIDDKQYNPKAVLNVIQRWKDTGLLPEKISSSDITSYLLEISFSVYKEYQRKLLSSDAVDFGDLLLYNIKLLTMHPTILQEYQHKFRYILIDEYQDTNIAQYIWVRFLAGHHKNICCVGDEDQSIFSWRGAELDNILRFEKDFGNATTIRLEHNYRSTHQIVSAASHVISNNKLRLGKNLWTDKVGQKINLVSAWDDKEEARYIINEIMHLKQNHDINLGEVAILVRAGFQTRTFEESFLSYAVPYKIIGGLRFYERAEIKDVIAYIRVTVNHNDNLALERIINLPKRAIGDATIKLISEHSRIHDISFFSAIENMLNNNEFRPKIKASLQILIDNFKKWHSLLSIKPHHKVIELVLEESGYINMWKQDKTLEAEGRLENIEELIKAIQDFNNITEFLEHVGLVNVTDTEDISNMVNIMTLHAAKGLEFKTVFLPGWEEGVFPHQKILDEENAKQLEEERRLAYVGMTRARERLYILFTLYRRIYNQYQNNTPSRFITELPEEHLERKSASYHNNSF